MSVLVIGGDHLGKIPSKLEKAGFTQVIHVSGRKRGQWLPNIPKRVDCIILWLII